MCTLFLALEKHTDFQVILIENRDEFYDRKSLIPHRWKDYDLFAGRDLNKNGTWLGYNSKGGWGVVTNYRDLSQKLGGEKSRGDLIPKIIGEKLSINQASNFLKKNSDDFGPFNLVFSIDEKVYYFSSIEKELKTLLPGIYGLSNAFLDTPWFKVKKGKLEFEKIIHKENFEKSALFEMMKDQEKAPENHLPQTGLPLEVEKLVSSIFIESESYGTHCSTILTKNRFGEVFFEEKRYK